MWSIVLSTLFVSGFSARHAQAPDSSSSLAPVYAALLADPRCSGIGVAGARGRDIVLTREAVVPTTQWWWNAFPHENFRAAIPTWLPGIDPETLQNFLDVTAKPAIIDPAVIRSSTAWISRREVDALARQAYFWQSFYERHPSATGLIELSSVGFAPDGREALVYCGRTSESLSGNGSLVLLRRDGERWKAVAWHEVWVS